MHARRRGAEARVQRWALRKQQTSPAAAAAAVQGRAERDSRHMWRREIRLGVICGGVCSNTGQQRAGGAARGAQAQENAHVRWPQGWGSPPDGMHPSLSGAPRASSTPPIRVLGAVEQPAGDANTTEEHRGVPAPRAGQTARSKVAVVHGCLALVLPAACAAEQRTASGCQGHLPVHDRPARLRCARSRSVRRPSGCGWLGAAEGECGLTTGDGGCCGGSALREKSAAPHAFSYRVVPHMTPAATHGRPQTDVQSECAAQEATGLPLTTLCQLQTFCTPCSR